MAYSPIGSDEVWGIMINRTDLATVPKEALSNMTDGLSRILKCCDVLELRSFNVVIFSSPFGGDSRYGSVVLKVTSRYGFQSQNVNDVWGLRYFPDESEIFDAPEDVATEMRKYFA